jgi:hypothetical protein
LIAVALFGSRVGTRARAESEFYTEADATRASSDAALIADAFESGQVLESREGHLDAVDRA